MLLEKLNFLKILTNWVDLKILTLLQIVYSVQYIQGLWLYNRLLLYSCVYNVNNDAASHK